jgi:hypothetical protein
MAQAGHTDPKMTLSVYASVIATEADHGASMDELVHKDVWARKGTNADFEGLTAEGATAPESEIPAADSGDFGEAADGIRTHDLLHGKQTL